MTAHRAGSTLITGATGYLGSLVAAALAADRSARLILLVRGRRDPASVVTQIIEQAARTHEPFDDQVGNRITVIAMPETFRALDILRAVRPFSVNEVVHCAGCLSYWNQAKLDAGNLLLTEELLDVAERLNVRRFVFLSSAFSSGYVDGSIAETLHADPDADPSPYTASKRDAERLVAASGLPFLMIRPSIVIGDSTTGRYSGKLSGLYQLWWAARRYLSGRQTVIHAVVPDIPVHLLHQDAFQAGFLAAYRHLPDNAIVHLVSRMETLPTSRQLWEALVARYLPECDTRYHDDPSEMPDGPADAGVRQFLSAVRTNTEISSRRWRFESTSLDGLRKRGIPFRDATLSTVMMCQREFMSASSRVDDRDAEACSARPQASCSTMRQGGMASRNLRP